MSLQAVQSSAAKMPYFGSEDCLYMNIYRSDNDEMGLPVMVFLHGGGNLMGGTSVLVGKNLARNANAIIISVQFRLDESYSIKNR